MLKNILLICLGFLLLLLGVVGIFIPILPTTPFVIGAFACFSVSPKLRALLLKNRFFAEHINNYKERKGLKLSTVIKSLSFLWLTMIISIALLQKLWVLILLSIIGLAVTLHILFMAKAPRNQNPTDCSD